MGETLSLIKVKVSLEGQKCLENFERLEVGYLILAAFPSVTVISPKSRPIKVFDDYSKSFEPFRPKIGAREDDDALSLQKRG